MRSTGAVTDKKKTNKNLCKYNNNLIFSRGEKYVALTPAKRLQVFAERISNILSAEGGAMPLFRLQFAYQFYQFESVVSPDDCECESFDQLLSKIPDYVEVGLRVIPIYSSFRQTFISVI